METLSLGFPENTLNITGVIKTLSLGFPKNTLNITVMSRWPKEMLVTNLKIIFLNRK